MQNKFGQRPPHGTLIVGALIFGALLVVGAAASPVRAQTGTIVGQVTDSRSTQPLGLTAITVEGTRLGATAGADGRYRIVNVPIGRHSLAARRIGYVVVRQTVTVAANAEATANFTLEAAAVALDQIVVTGTAGGELRRSISNAVSKIDASAELEKSAATNITSLLNARSPGLTVQTTSGRVGAVPAIQIRGRSSISLANNPLIYIDGVRVNSQTALGPVGTGGLGTQGALVAGRLNDINPDDIESIEVISGPAAATIYGTEASSGVIQIITKRGSAGSGTVMTGQASVGSLQFRNAAGRIGDNYDKDKTGNLVLWNGVQQEADSGRPIFKTGLTRQYNASASGGQNLARYYLSSGYENDYGIEPNNSSRAANAHLNVSVPVGSSSDLTTSLNFVDKSDHLGAEVGASALFGAQVGHILLSAPTHGFFATLPQVPQQLYDNSDATNRFTGSVTVTNRPTNWFTQRGIVGLDYVGEDSRAIEHFAPPDLAATLSAATAAGRIGQTLRHNSIISADYNGTAKVNLTSALASNLSVGGQFYNTELNQSFLGSTGFPAPGVETVTAGAVKLAPDQQQTINTTIGAYAQEQLGWRDRLFITGAIRVDNNSAFGDQFKWVTYPKIGASWVVNEEPFWHWSSTIPTLRLRAAYGESGRQPQAFSALRTFTPVTGANGASGVTPGTIGNPDLKPERGKELELGFESGITDRLTTSLTYFSRRTYDEIINQPVAPSSGFPGSRFANLGRVDNHGLEIQATFQAIRKRNLAWEIAGNIGTNKDVIKSLGGLPSLITAVGPANVVGYPVNGWWSKRVLSADRDANGFAANVKCDDGKGTGVACASAPFAFMGTQTPSTTGSVANTVTIGRLRLYGLVDFKRGYTELGTVELERCAGILGAGLCRANYFPNEYSALYDAEATVAAYSGNYWDQYFQNGNFVKLREVSATYDVPARWVRGLSRVSFTLAARELHTWTKFRGLDPEAMSAIPSLTTGNVSPSDQGVSPPPFRLIGTVNVAW
jgi:TonB-linked SusC/RagA family outer membrane protein